MTRRQKKAFETRLSYTWLGTVIMFVISKRAFIFSSSDRLDKT